VDPAAPLPEERDSLGESLLEIIKGRIDPDVLPLVSAFLKASARRLPAVAIGANTVERLAATLLELFKFTEHSHNQPARIRVFQPTDSEHGYQTRGSVVEVNIPDSPFLLDSMTAEIHEHGAGVDWVVHPVLGVTRDTTGRLIDIAHATRSPQRESVQHLELDRPLDHARSEALKDGIDRVLADVRRVVADFEPMKKAVEQMMGYAQESSEGVTEEETAEALAFLHWLLDDNFVFLGYREYQITDSAADRTVCVVPGTGLGILSEAAKSAYARPVPLSKLPTDLRDRYEHGDLLVVTKTNRLSTVHRRAKMDYVGVRRIGGDGETWGEARLLGLFTSKAYMEPVARTPLIRRKLERILEAEDLIAGSHDHKAVIQVFEGFPKDSLFSAPIGELHRSVMGLVHLQEGRNLRLFIRPDILRRSVSILVALPRDRFNVALRRQLQELFKERFNGESVEYHLALGNADPAQIHYTVWVGRGDIPTVDHNTLEREAAELSRGWDEHLLDRLAAKVGQERARQLVAEWSGRLPGYYKNAGQLQLAADDLLKLDELVKGERPFVVGIQNETGPGEQLTRLGLYRLEGKLPLSELVPALEDLGLRVVEEVATRLSGGDGETFIHDFGVVDAAGAQLDVSASGQRITDALAAVWNGEAESDSLHRLILNSRLTQKQIEVIRAYRMYARRVSPGFTIAYTNDTLVRHPEISSKLIELFEARFDSSWSGGGADAIRAAIVAELDAVSSLEEDRILRTFLGLVEATVRTNAFKGGRSALAFKLRSAEVPAMPKPHPLFEIFAYGQDVEGIHLRGGMVARGGIRWSDRREDYRTEVLGLMKAQMTKNAVIVPTGAKGGFVLRQPPSDPAHLKQAVRGAYQTFIASLLDLTDNRIDGEIRHPPEVLVHDEPDPYLVVAADKGTATFSDTANQVAAQFNFWLGDAFASGGSSGYDHKALGITARGAFESMRWHFREAGIDFRKPFTVVGIGDMSGDVFGNGMLLSDKIKLVAAFDHRHIFIDPAPEPARSFSERRRLFELPGSSWADYRSGLISVGGGIYPRTAKRIDLSLQAQAALGASRTTFTPNELISALLCAPVDLLWNGGIGTYIKAESETHGEVGDRPNDALRVDASRLRCRVVVEGGNLGLTQKGRIEYAGRGGHINADFIDNSGGVDCSDREVNLKILLSLAEADGRLDRQGRHRLVAAVADEVVERILYGNFLQAQILAQDEAASPRRMEAFEDLMGRLEKAGVLDREVEALPSTEMMRDRQTNGLGMSRPELAVLLAYSKSYLADLLLASDVPEAPYLLGDIRRYFPAKVVELGDDLLARHPLRRELIATLVANDVVNSMGAIFVTRLMDETGAEAVEVVQAYRMARHLCWAVQRWEAVEELVDQLPLATWKELMHGIDWLVAITTRWFLGRGAAAHSAEEMAAWDEPFEELVEVLPEIGPAVWRDERQATVQRLVALGVPVDVARRHAFQEHLVHAPDIIDVARTSGWPVAEVGRVFFLVGQSARIDQLERQAQALSSSDRWQRWALRGLQADLLGVRRHISEQVIAEATTADGEAATHAYFAARSHRLGRLVRFMRTLEGERVADLAQLSVAVRQIRTLAGAGAR
jgi:glutamate dehydrogenase